MKIAEHNSSTTKNVFNACQTKKKSQVLRPAATKVVELFALVKTFQFEKNVI